MKAPRILVIEDDTDGRRSVTEALRELGFEAACASDGTEGLRQFAAQPFDAVLTDLVMPNLDGIEVMRRAARINPSVPVLIMTAYGSVASAVEALKGGAYDYITKPLDLNDLHSKLSRAVETCRLRTQVAQLEQSVRERYTASSMVATAPAMREVVAQIEALAPTQATVLILGESGTGKELVARALHVDGKRRQGPFVAVNCGALAESILESELFGHEKGAFTGAATLHRGAFERAHGGTLFLDEIGNAPSSVQIKLLRVLEEREVMRLGGQAPVAVDVRVVSASNRDLDELVEAGEFRADLLYRLKVVTIQLPPLRQRREDVRPLADRFLAAACEEHGRSIAGVEPGFYEALEAFDWPGNVRQLRNTMEAAVVMAVRPQLRVSDLKLKTVGKVGDEKPQTPPAEADGKTLAVMEKEALIDMLRRCDGNRTLVAEKLGLSRRTIQRKIKEYELPF
jgi:DNA-binding NtrC family response regulator